MVNSFARFAIACSTLAVLGSLVFASAASASPVALPYIQTFSTPSTNFTADYPEFTTSLAGGTATVDNSGILHLTSSGSSSDQLVTVQLPTATAPIYISGQVTASNSNGNYNVGMTIGGNALVFHPGLAGGAFRVEGPGGFGNTDMGFMPQNGVLETLQVVSFPNGLFNITLIDGANPSNVFHASFTDAAAYDTTVGFRRSGPASGDGQFDNLIITPEPSALLSGLIGMLGLAAAYCYRGKRSQK